MPGFLLHLGATILCGHATGQAQPMTSNPRVTVAGQPVVTLADSFTVAGCTNPPVSGGPCVTARYITGATRVRVAGQPVLLQDSQAVCSPVPVPLSATVVQPRVRGQ